MRTIPVGDDESHRVDPKHRGTLTTPRPGITNLYDLILAACKRYENRNCAGTREFLGQHNEKQKKFGEVTWKTYNEINEEAHKFGAALRGVGMVPAPDEATLEQITTPCSLAIFENTCQEWITAAYGAFSQSIIVTTIYATLGIDAVIDAINDGVITTILCNKTNVQALVDRIGSIPTIKTIVFTDNMVAPDTKIEIPEVDGIKIVSYEEFCNGGDTAAYPPTPPKPKTCAVIMYTSGSTGKPKGVVIKHENTLGAIASASLGLGVQDGTDVYLAYLPLAHIMEMMAEFVMIEKGCTLCYADPKTLTTTGAYPIGALEQYSPTVMIAVPKIWDTIKKGVQAKIAQGSKLKQKLAAMAFASKEKAILKGKDTPFWNALVFKKFSVVVGGKLRVAVSGGGPLNSDVQVFIRTAFGCPLFQGYGLTETCAGVTLQDPMDLREGIAGVVIPSAEVKLVPCPDILDKNGKPYMNTDRTDADGNEILGRGEILIKGSNISLGYYKMPEKTAEVFQPDGFFCTGDIGQFMDDGSLRIVDRKKNLVKLKGGEYVALENMEMVYGNSSFVDAIGGGICCYGDGDMDRPVALLQLNQTVAMQWAFQNGVKGDFETVKNSKALYNAVMNDLLSEHKKSSLSKLEKLVAVSLLTDPWTPENGCLTAANKLERRKVIATFPQEFEAVKAKGIS